MCKLEKLVNLRVGNIIELGKRGPGIKITDGRIGIKIIAYIILPVIKPHRLQAGIKQHRNVWKPCIAKVVMCGINLEIIQRGVCGAQVLPTVLSPNIAGRKH